MKETILKITLMNNKTVLITGGTGSFGKFFSKLLLKKFKIKKLILYSRDEMKQWDMRYVYKDPRIEFIIGDVRDKDRIEDASRNVDILIHAAATKIVPTAESNPSECIKTNVIGALNVIDAAKKNKIKKVIALSTDKACNPINIYGASKLTSDKLFISNNDYENKNATKFSVVRYGNVMNSRGSVIPFFLSLKKNNYLPITHLEMTRFMITLDDASDLVILALSEMIGGEIFVKKIPSMRVIDIAKAVNEKAKIKIIGIRPGEKLHEQMVSKYDSNSTIEFKDYYNLPMLNIKIYKKNGSEWKESRKN